MKNFYPDNISSFSDKMKHLRNTAKMTLKELSEKSSIGIESIKNYERSAHYPSIANLIKLANIFSVSMDFLLCDETDYPRNLRLLTLSEKLDQTTTPPERNHIETTAKSFLGNKVNTALNMKQDSGTIKLSGNIHENIRILKEANNISSNQIAESLGVTMSQVSHYLHESLPPVEKLPLLSSLFDTSIHAISTGKELRYLINDKKFSDVMHLSDKFLSFEHQRILIELMETLLKK